jgi:hypothetical protein
LSARAAPAPSLLAPLAILVPLVATPIGALEVLSSGNSVVTPVLAILVLLAGGAAIVVAGRATYGVGIAIASTWAAASSCGSSRTP